MAYDVRSRPGAWVLRQAALRERWILVGLTAFLIVDVLVVALVLGHRLSALGAFLVFGVLISLRGPAERYAERHERWARGGLAEQAVGVTLEELPRGEWVVMHDVDCGFGGNVDHLVSGTGGVFLVETKHRLYLDKHLPKAKHQAALVHDELGVWVTPVICIDQRRGKPFKTQGVWVVPRREILAWLRAQHNKPVDFERLARWADKQ